MGLPKYYEDFTIGEKIKTHTQKIDYCDVKLFAACTGMCARIHYDPEYCAKIEELKDITIPYSLLINIIDGLYTVSVSPDRVPTFHYGYDKTEYLKPAYPGDSIYTVFELVDKVIKNDKFGVLTFDTCTYNQNNELLIHHIDKLYVGRKSV